MKYGWWYFKHDYESDIVDLTNIGINNISNVILNVPFFPIEFSLIRW